MRERPTYARTPNSHATNLSDEQRLNWLRLIRCENVGPATFRDLINHFGSASEALNALPELISKGGSARKIKITSLEAAEKELEYAYKKGVRFVGMGEPEYPSILRNIDYPPPLLCTKGNLEIFNKTAVAIVGSRNASIAGKKITSQFASQLGAAGFSIVSGLARGIDTNAHQSSLKTGTIAVFAGGVDHIFPEENSNLANAIVENDGILVSEMPLGWRPRSQDFPKRNRLVAGLAEATLVVEAAKKSGSLISARLANEAGRTVYAVPGSPLDPRSAGANWLIKNGATLTVSANEIIDELTQASIRLREMDEDDDFFKHRADNENDTEAQNAGNSIASLTSAEPVEVDSDLAQKVIDALGPSPIEVDDIIRFTNASTGQIQLILIELALEGRIERHGGNRVSLIG